MRVSEIRPGELSDSERALWAGFVQTDGAPAGAYTGWQFATVVGDVRQDARVAVIEDGEGVLAFLPYHRRPMGLARPIGAPFSDYHGPVVRPGAALDLPAALRALGLSAYMHTALPAPEGGDGACRPVFGEEQAYVAEVGSDGEAYLTACKEEHKTRFRGFQKRMRKAERERGPVEMLVGDRGQDIYDFTIGFKRRQYRLTGKHDVLGPKWAQEMFQRLREWDEPDFGLRLASMRIGGQLAAGELCLLGNGVLHSWIAAYDPEFSNVAPGIQLIGALLVGAPGIGASSVDFGTTEADYKQIFSTPRGRYLEGACCAAGAAGAARRATLEAWRAAERAPLGPVSTFAGKLRRRSAQIAAVETALPGRARGIVAALAGANSEPASA